MSRTHSATDGTAIHATGVDTMHTSIQGELLGSPRSLGSLKLMATPQRPGPNGSRVSKRKPSIPQLGAGLRALAAKLNSSSIPTTGHQLIDDVDVHVAGGEDGGAHEKPRRDSFGLISVGSGIQTKRIISQGMVKTTQLIIKRETEYSSTAYASPTGSSEEEVSFDSSANLFDNDGDDDNELSSPNSTPPPIIIDQQHGEKYSVLATPMANGVASRLTNDHLSSLGYLTATDSTTCSDVTAPYNTKDVVPGTFLGLPKDKIEEIFNKIEFLKAHAGKDRQGQRDDHLDVVPQVPLTTQPDLAAAHPSPQCPNPAPIYQATQENFVSAAPLGPYRTEPFSNQVPRQPFTGLSMQLKATLLEDKLARYIAAGEAHGTEHSSTGVHVFVDMSNIWIGFLNGVKDVLGVPPNRKLASPMSFENLARILERGRNVQKRVLAGSLGFASRRENWPIYLKEAEHLEYEMNIFERVPVEKKTLKYRRQYRTASHRSTLSNPYDTTSADESMEDGAAFEYIMKNGEQGVDEILHLNMMHSIVDSNEPGIMVLATGDGAQAQFSDGFKKHATRALRAGWKVEVVSWSRNLSSAWRDPEFLAEFGDRFRIIPLDEFIEELHAGDRRS